MTTKCEWKDCDFKLDEIYAFDQLLDHIKNIHIHTGHQKCEWYTCDFTGRYARELLDHQVSHMDKNFRPYKCTLCDKDLKRHDKTHENTSNSDQSNRKQSSEDVSIPVIGRHYTTFATDYTVLDKVFNISFTEQHIEQLEYYRLHGEFVPISIVQEIHEWISNIIENSSISFTEYMSHRTKLFKEIHSKNMDGLVMLLKSSIQSTLDSILQESKSRANVRQHLIATTPLDKLLLPFHEPRNNFVKFIIDSSNITIQQFKNFNTAMQFTLVETFNKTDCSKCMVGVCIKWPDAICTYSKLRYQVDLTQIFEYWAKHVNSVYKSLIWKNRNDVLFAQELCCRGIYCGNRRECFAKVDLRLIDDGMVIWTRLGLDQVFVEATLPDVVEFKSFVY